jgi:hypothetical protein
MSKPPVMMDSKLNDQNLIPQQMNGAQFKQQFWSSNQQIMTPQQFNTQPDGFHSQIR